MRKCIVCGGEFEDNEGIYELPLGLFRCFRCFLEDSLKDALFALEQLKKLEKEARDD